MWSQVQNSISFQKMKQKYYDQEQFMEKEENGMMMNVDDEFFNNNTEDFDQIENKQQSTQQPILASQYRTSINQLISQPAQDSIYSMQNLYQSLFQLSDYLWNKKLLNKYSQQPNSNESSLLDVSFDEYLLPIKEELLTYEKFRRNKTKEMEKIQNILNQEQQLKNNKNDIQKDQSNKKNEYQNAQRKIKKLHSFNNKQSINRNNKSASLESQLVKCYQRVPFIYFQQQFTLDFGNFYTKEHKLKFTNTDQMRQEQQKMNDQLDMIEINLFGQIHKKFEDYFKAAANFDYLHESIIVQLNKLASARSRVRKVQAQFVQKSTKLRKKIIERNNYEKALKKLKLMRSLRKLPQIIQTILQSSLPYECLQLLNSTKSSISQVKQIKSIGSTLDNIKSAQTLVQLGLNKRYTDELYLYVEEEVVVGIHFEQQFKKLLKQCRLLEDREMNSSTVHNMSTQSNSRRSSQIGYVNDKLNRSINNRSGMMILGDLTESRGPLESDLGESRTHMQADSHNSQSLLKNTYCKRQQAKEYEIAMILIQSYEYVSFPVQVTKIKLTNGLRVVAKRFEKELIKHVKAELTKRQHLNNIHQNIQQQSSNQSSNFTTDGSFSFISNNNNINNNKSTNSSTQQQTPQQIRQLFNQVSVQSYIMHIKILNELFKQTINRYLTYILTLVTEYQEKLHKEIVDIQNKANYKSSQSSNPSIHSLSQSTIKSQSSSKEIIQSKDPSESLSNSKIRKLEEKSQRLSKLQQSHNKFKTIFSQQITILPSIFKIIQQKVKYFLTLKNMSTASPQQFYEWIGLVRYWQRWFDFFVDESSLLNYACTYFGQGSTQQINSSSQLFSLGHDMISQLTAIVLQNIKKSISAMNIKNLITELTLSYLNSYSTMICAQMNQAIMEESWQSVEIPQQFSDVLQSIITKPTDNHNMSLTILNSSTSHMSTSFINKKEGLFSNNQSQQYLSTSNNASNASKFKFKILKNNILLQGQRYKLTSSFLLLCEFISQMVQVGRQFQTITGETDQQSIKQSKHIRFILSHLYQKVYELIDAFNSKTKQMILDKKALKMQKIKGNNITVKHICLLSNCLTFLQKLTIQIPQKELSLIINKKQQQQQTILGLANHNTLLIDKISSILNKKMQQIIAGFKSKEQQKTFSVVSLLQFVTQNNQSIVSLFLQITEIIDQYLDVDKCEKILKGPFQLFVQKYFKFIILKGDKFVQQARLVLEKMKFLKKFFKSQFVIMQREIEQ